MHHRHGLIEALCALGFTTYEARTYTGLLEGHGQTAYGLSKITGVPQPKIYEVLRKLEMKGAAVLVNAEPQKFSATSPQELLTRLRTEFEARMEIADSAVAITLSSQGRISEAPEVVTGLYGWESVMGAARNLLSEAREKVYFSAWIPELTELRSQIESAAGKDVFFITLAFGPGKLPNSHGQLYRHRSTLKNLYHHHQNRHLALVVDGKSILWATKFGEEEGWTGILASDRRLVGLVRSYIRHDIYVQKIYERFGSELVDTFGPGLELLADVSRDLLMSDLTADTEKASSAVKEGAV